MRQQISKLRWNTAMVAVLFALLPVAAMLFAFNPLMSLPMDWDVFCIAGVVAMVLLLAVVQQLNDDPLPRPVLLVPVALLPLYLLPFVVLTNVQQHAQRMEAVGIHVFKTYYAHSATYLLYSANMIEGNPEHYDARKQYMLQTLKPCALPGKDTKYAELLLDQALFELGYRNNVPAAITALEQALQYAPNYHRAREQLMQQYSRTGKYHQAFEAAKTLASVPYPTLEQALRNGMLTAADAGLKDACLTYWQSYQNRIGPNDELQRLANQMAAR